MVSYKYDIINKITKCLIIYDNNNGLIEDLRSKKYVSLLREAYYKLLTNYQLDTSNSDKVVSIKCDNIVESDVLECFLMVIGIDIQNYNNIESMLIELYENSDRKLVVSSSSWNSQVTSEIASLYSISYNEFIEALDQTLKNLIEIIASIRQIDLNELLSDNI